MPEGGPGRRKKGMIDMAEREAPKRMTATGRVAGFLGGAAIVLALCLLLPATVCSFGLLAKLSLAGPFEEWIDYVAQSAARNVVLTAVALAALMGVKCVMERFSGIHLTAIMQGLWLIAALFWVIGIGVVQERDCEAVLNAAKAFAVNDYSDLTWGYFMGCPFQLGIVFFLEMLARLLPGVDTNLLMQCINAFAGVATMGVMAALAETIFGGDEVRRAALLLYMAFLPLLLFSIFVYGTMLMILLCAVAFLCFARYLRTRKLRLAVAMAVSMALAYVAKPNALIPAVALTICAVLEWLSSRDWRALLCAVLGIALGVALCELVIWQYELRSGIELVRNVDRMTWLMMGLDTPASQPGWYNGYVGVYFDLYLTPQEQKAQVYADLARRILELLADPAGTAAFMRDKYLSQWLEPTYSTMIYGERCFWSGHFNGLAVLFYRDSAINRAVNAYMDVFQQAMYVLACIGLLCALRRRGDAAAVVLPVTLIGGVLFHQLFEAKSQYIFPYAVYMMPLAAQGLCVIERGIRRILKRAARRT